MERLSPCRRRCLLLLAAGKGGGDSVERFGWLAGWLASQVAALLSFAGQ